MRSLILPLALALAICGCHGGASKTEGPAGPQGEQKAVRYFCPTHPQVTSTGPEKCRVCGRLLVPEER